MAMPIDRFTALVTGFAATAQLIIEDDGAAARVRSGRSRYTRRLFRAGGLPLALTVAADAARVELSRDQALALFATGFCAARDATRTSYAGSILLTPVPTA